MNKILSMILTILGYLLIYSNFEEISFKNFITVTVAGLMLGFANYLYHKEDEYERW